MKKNNIFLHIVKKINFIPRFPFMIKTYKRVFTYALHNVKRNKILAVSTVFVTALIVFVFNVAVIFNFAADEIIFALSKKVDIRVQIKNNAGSFRIQSFINDLKNNPLIKEAVYTSKEDALSGFRLRHPDIYGFIKQYNLDNPLPSSVGIVLSDIRNSEEVISFLEKDIYSNVLDIKEIKNNTAQTERIKKLLMVTKGIKKSGKILNILFLMIVILIISNALNVVIHNHKEEIFIMKLVGAKDNFIAGPFVLEGIMFLLSAALLGPMLILFFIIVFGGKLHLILSNIMMSQAFDLLAGKFYHNIANLFILQILFGIVLGWGLSLLIVKKYLSHKTV